MRHGFEIVEQLHSRNVELFRQLCTIDHPREIGRLRMVLKDGAGDAETSRFDFRRFFRWALRFRLGSSLLGYGFVNGRWGGRRDEKFSEHVFKRGVIGALERLQSDGIDAVLFPVEQG